MRSCRSRERPISKWVALSLGRTLGGELHLASLPVAARGHENRQRRTPRKTTTRRPTDLVYTEKSETSFIRLLNHSVVHHHTSLLPDSPNPLLCLSTENEVHLVRQIAPHTPKGMLSWVEHLDAADKAQVPLAQQVCFLGAEGGTQ